MPLNVAALFSFAVLTVSTCRVKGALEKTAAIEGCVIDCLLAMVMKLSEVTFRPLFFKVTVGGGCGQQTQGVSK